MGNRKKIVILGVIMLLMILVGGLFVIHRNEKLPSELEQNNNGNVIKNVNGLEFSNIKIQMISENNCKLEADVLNTNAEIMEAKIIKITVTDDENLKEVFGAQIPSILPNEKITLSTTIRKDITAATNIEFEISN